jgi:hypothetical protein
VAEPKRSTCRSCGAPIIWSTTIGLGRRIPLDAEPVGDGNVVLTLKGAMVSPPSGVPDPTGSKRYKSHFSTCPNAAKHRRGKAESQQS